MAFIAKASEGVCGDALSIMDQAIAFGDGTLTLQDALNVTGSVHDEALDHLFDDIVQGVQASFKKYHQFITEGKEVNRLINDMIYFVRDTIMNKTSEKDTEYRALMNLELDMLYQMIDLINDTLVSIRFSVNQNVHFEVLLVKLAEQIKGQPQVIANVAEPAQIAFIAKHRCIVATYGTVRARTKKH
ncbi:DNA polymerase III subunits gamma and Tau [Staphylococcus aureus]|nr:DNA polymerase III subunits gamma and Tau [Staphylococcus aureus]